MAVINRIKRDVDNSPDVSFAGNTDQEILNWLNAVITVPDFITLTRFREWLLSEAGNALYQLHEVVDNLSASNGRRNAGQILLLLVQGGGFGTEHLPRPLLDNAIADLTGTHVDDICTQAQADALLTGGDVSRRVNLGYKDYGDTRWLELIADARALP